MYRLAIHLDNQDAVYFRADASLDELQYQVNHQTSTLTAYFKYNTEHADGRSILYPDFPAHYVYQRKERHWTPRQRGFAIGRMWFVHFREGERFFLRQLLTVVPGAISFENLYTINGVIHPIFKDACTALGLLEDDNYWINCFAEASVWSTGKELYALFVSALTYRDVVDARELWSRFQIDLCDDL